MRLFAQYTLVDAGLDIVESVSVELDTDHQTASADLLDFRIMDLFQTIHEVLALLTCQFRIIVTLQDLECLDTAGTGQRIATES